MNDMGLSRRNFTLIIWLLYNASPLVSLVGTRCPFSAVFLCPRNPSIPLLFGAGFRTRWGRHGFRRVGVRVHLVYPGVTCANH
jgi:hypothetical protein